MIKINILKKKKKSKVNWEVPLRGTGCNTTNAHVGVVGLESWDRVGHFSWFKSMSLRFRERGFTWSCDFSLHMV